MLVLDETGLLEDDVELGVPDDCAELGVLDNCAELGVLDDCVELGVLDDCVELGVLDDCVELDVLDDGVKLDVLGDGCEELKIGRVELSSPPECGSLPFESDGTEELAGFGFTDVTLPIVDGVELSLSEF